MDRSIVKKFDLEYESKRLGIPKEKLKEAFLKVYNELAPSGSFSVSIAGDVRSKEMSSFLHIDPRSMIGYATIEEIDDEIMVTIKYIQSAHDYIFALEADVPLFYRLSGRWVSDFKDVVKFISLHLVGHRQKKD